VYLAEPSTRNF